MVPLVVHAVIHVGMIDFHRPRLDHGGGKDLSLPECTRERLEKEVRSRFISLIHDSPTTRSLLHSSAQRIM